MKYKTLIVPQQDGSVNKTLAAKPEDPVHFQELHGGRQALTPTSCPVNST